MPGFIAKKSSGFFMPLDIVLGMDKDKYCSFTVLCCYKIIFFGQLPWDKPVSLFYLLSWPTQISFAGWASLLVLLKHSFKFSIQSSAQFIPTWSKLIEYFVLTKINKTKICQIFYILPGSSLEKLLPCLSHIILITWRINQHALSCRYII